jgi:hypothetical protein
MTHNGPMPLVLGPVLRRVVGDTATIWAEVDRPGTVRVRAGSAEGTAATITAYGHHYALVQVRGLPPGAATPYQVLVDGRTHWPPEPGAGGDRPPSVIRTHSDGAPVRIGFGSCYRPDTPLPPPDALLAYAERCADDGDLPDLLLLLGDQVYADERGKHAQSFDGYAALYREVWGQPAIRWLLSTVPTAMIFDDHEIVDDWNSSAAWLADVRKDPEWRARIGNGLSSYWIYQHLGNLEPDELAADPVFAKVTAASTDATEILTDFAREAARGSAVPEPYRWSYTLDVGRTRVVVLDNRANRVLDPDARRMLPPAEWEWFTREAGGDCDHLVIGSSLPWLLAPALHHLEALTEKICTVPGSRRSTIAERARRMFDLEHWAAVGASFDALTEVLAGVAAGGGPASVTVLSGDVHHSYVARAGLPGVPVHQVTCSPLRNRVDPPMRAMLRTGWWPGMRAGVRRIGRLAGVPRQHLRWRRRAGPYFGTAIGTLVLDGRSARVTIDGARTDHTLAPVLQVALS